MNTLMTRPKVNRNLKKIFITDLFLKIHLYIDECSNINLYSPYKHTRKNFAPLIKECFDYFKQIHKAMNTKVIMDKIIFGKRYLESILPTVNNPDYYKALKKMNDIIQTCMYEKSSQNFLSKKTFRELQENNNLNG